MAKYKLTAFGMDCVPRISRAQVFDALSSMGNISGTRFDDIFSFFSRKRVLAKCSIWSASHRCPIFFMGNISGMRSDKI